MFWNVRATPRAVMRSARQPVMSWPSNTRRPALGASTPVTRLKSVVLPAPFGPITAWMAPGSTTSVDVGHGREPAERLRQALDGEHRYALCGRRAE